MGEIASAPRLWSDFDGTAVEIVSKANPRNWSKYPLKSVPGYVDFLRGVRRGGVEVAGAVSVRPDIMPRRWATSRSVATLGLTEFFGNSAQLVLTGNEKDKAQHLVTESLGGRVGMIDDKPHRIGLALLDALSKREQSQQRVIVLGVVAHQRSQEYLDRFVTEAATQTEDLLMVEPDCRTVSVHGLSYMLQVTSLEPYSEIAGTAFAQQIAAAA